MAALSKLCHMDECHLAVQDLDDPENVGIHLIVSPRKGSTNFPDVHYTHCMLPGLVHSLGTMACHLRAIPDLQIMHMGNLAEKQGDQDSSEAQAAG